MLVKIPTAEIERCLKFHRSKKIRIAAKNSEISVDIVKSDGTVYHHSVVGVIEEEGSGCFKYSEGQEVFQSAAVTSPYSWSAEFTADYNKLSKGLKQALKIGESRGLNISEFIKLQLTENSMIVSTLNHHQMTEIRQQHSGGSGHYYIHKNMLKNIIVSIRDCKSLQVSGDYLRFNFEDYAVWSDRSAFMKIEKPDFYWKKREEYFEIDRKSCLEFLKKNNKKPVLITPGCPSILKSGENSILCGTSNIQSILRFRPQHLLLILNNHKEETLRFEGSQNCAWGVESAERTDIIMPILI